MYPLEVIYPDDPTRLCRPKAGQSLVYLKYMDADKMRHKVSKSELNLFYGPLPKVQWVTLKVTHLYFQLVTKQFYQRGKI